MINEKMPQEGSRLASVGRTCVEEKESRNLDLLIKETRNIVIIRKLKIEGRKSRLDLDRKIIPDRCDHTKRLTLVEFEGVIP